MDDEQIIQRYHALQEIRFHIRLCFGSDDYIFNGHQMEIDNAMIVQKTAKKNNISGEEIYDMLLSYLYRNGCNCNHIQEQMKRVIEFFGLPKNRYNYP